MFGDAINLSARLMMKCKERKLKGDLLCDEATYAHACSMEKVTFEELKPITVKVGGWKGWGDASQRRPSQQSRWVGGRGGGAMPARGGFLCEETMYRA